MKHAQVGEGEFFTSTTEVTTVEEKTEFIEEEREEVWYIPDISPPQTFTERDDDWFVLLDVGPRQTPFVIAGTKICSAFQNSFALVVFFCFLLYVGNL